MALALHHVGMLVAMESKLGYFPESLTFFQIFRKPLPSSPVTGGGFIPFSKYASITASDIAPPWDQTPSIVG